MLKYLARSFCVFKDVPHFPNMLSAYLETQPAYLNKRVRGGKFYFHPSYECRSRKLCFQGQYTEVLLLRKVLTGPVHLVTIFVAFAQK